MKVNEKNLLYGFKLKESIVYTKDEDWLYRSILITFFLNSYPIISALEHHNPFVVSLFTESLQIPVISHSEDPHSKHQMDSYQFQITPNEKFRLSAAVAIVKQLKWDYVIIISSSGRTGNEITSLFVQHLLQFDICDAKSYRLPLNPSDTDYIETVRGANATKATGLVLFTNTRDSKGIAFGLRALSLKSRFQILALSGFTNYVEVTKGNEVFLEGTISIEFATTENQEFRNYFLSLKRNTYTDKPFSSFWRYTFNCSVGVDECGQLPNCSGAEKLRVNEGYYPNTPVNYVINSVFSFAYAIRRYIEKKCNNKPPCKIPSITSPKEKRKYFLFLNTFLASESFADKTLNISDPITNLNPAVVSYNILNYIRTESGFQNKILGNWTFERDGKATPAFNASQLVPGYLILNSEIIWTRTKKQAVSSCRPQCRGGETWEQSMKLGTCCIKCTKCKENDIVANNSCIDCGNDGRPNMARLGCVPLEVQHFGNDSSSKRAILAYIGLSAIGVIATLFVIFIFIKFNDNKLVRASGRDLSYVILCGICVLFLSPIGFLVAPSRAICVSRDIIPGIAFCMCYSPLFLKTNRIYRIFCNAQTSVARPNLISPQSQLCLLLNIIGVQVLLGIVWMLGTAKKITKVYDKQNGVVTHHCSNRALSLVLNMLLSVFFMCCCTWYAFKTRNFPKNYNESKYIAFTMYLTFLAWAVFLPTYFSANELSYAHDHLICATLIAAAFVTLLGLFGQKVQIIVMPTRAQKERQVSDVSRQEADPNRFQMQSHKLNSISLQRGTEAMYGQRRFTSASQDVY